MAPAGTNPTGADAKNPNTTYGPSQNVLRCGFYIPLNQVDVNLYLINTLQDLYDYGLWKVKHYFSNSPILCRSGLSP